MLIGIIYHYDLYNTSKDFILSTVVLVCAFLT